MCTLRNKNTIGNIVKYWHQEFENNSIADPVESIEYIVAHVIGTKKVKEFSITYFPEYFLIVNYKI